MVCAEDQKDLNGYTEVWSDYQRRVQTDNPPWMKYWVCTG